MSINKIHYDQIGLVGRERETKILNSCLARMMMASIEEQDNQQEPRKKELIFIKGYSGTGKSRLAHTLEKQVNSMKNGMFAKGKFDLNNNDVPFSGIAATFGEICRTMKSTHSTAQEGNGEQEEDLFA
eukprot:1976757-Ditylum_brightwellii.AAC.1